MGADKFELVLDRFIYYAGQVIAGTVILEIEEQMKVEEITINYYGKGRVLWAIGKTTYEGIEKHLEISSRIFGNETGTCKLNPGRHVFRFNFQLPINLPCSFKDRVGRIKYSVEAEVHRPWKFNLVAEKLITIISIFDLNLEASTLAVPTSINKTKTFWGHSGKLFLSADIPVSGFVSGQIIPIKVSMNNKTGVSVNSIVATLIQVGSYHVKKHNHYERVNLVSKNVELENGVGSKSIYLNIQVPALPPSNMEKLSQIMDFKYLLKVKAKVGSFRCDTRIETEIKIGNIPLMTYQKPILNQQQQQSSPTHSESVVAFPQLADYGDFSPPKFKCLDVNLCRKVKPDLHYPVYTFDTMPKGTMNN